MEEEKEERTRRMKASGQAIYTTSSSLSLLG